MSNKNNIYSKDFSTVGMYLVQMAFFSLFQHFGPFQHFAVKTILIAMYFAIPNPQSLHDQAKSWLQRVITMLFP